MSIKLNQLEITDNLWNATIDHVWMYAGRIFEELSANSSIGNAVRDYMYFMYADFCNDCVNGVDTSEHAECAIRFKDDLELWLAEAFECFMYRIPTNMF